MPPDFTLDLGFIGSRRDGKPRFRSSAPPPDGAERVGSQRRVSDGAGRPRLRAAPRSLPAGEILLVPPLHGCALRSVVNGALFMCISDKCGFKKAASYAFVWSICSPYYKLGKLLGTNSKFTVKGNGSDFVGISKLAKITHGMLKSFMFYSL